MSGYYNLEELRSIENGALRYETARDAFEKGRTQIASGLFQELQDKGFSIRSVAADIGIDIGSFSRILNQKRPFAMLPGALEKLATKYLLKSTHEVMFGEPAVSMLPRHLSWLVKAMKHQSAATRKEISDYAASVYDVEKAEGLLPDKTTEAIIRQRITEIAADLYVHPMSILGEDAAFIIKACLKKYLYTEQYIGNLNSLMFYAFELNTTLDYFIALDYSSYTTLGYLYNGRIIEVTDKNAKSFISHYLRLSEKGQEDTLTQAYVLLSNHAVSE